MVGKNPGISPEKELLPDHQTKFRLRVNPGKISSPDNCSGASKVWVGESGRYISTWRFWRFISHPNRTPLSRYSCILAWAISRSSEGDISSSTKSGAMGGNFSRASGGRASQRSFLIQATSGERLAPLGSLKPVDESKTSPSPASSFQTTKRLVSFGVALARFSPGGWHEDKFSPGVALNFDVGVGLTQVEKLLL